MITIKRKYHFYAAHRNELLVGQKCANIHGHTYHVELEVYPGEQKSNGVTILFEEIDERAAYVINTLDHCLIIHRADPLLKVLEDSDLELKIMVLDWPTSAENIAKFLYYNIKRNLNTLTAVTVQETESAIVTYRP